MSWKDDLFFEHADAYTNAVIEAGLRLRWALERLAKQDVRGCVGHLYWLAVWLLRSIDA